MSIEIRNLQFQEAISAIDNKINDFCSGISDKINAAAGLILSKTNRNAERFLLMGKLNRPDPKDPANVDGTYGIFSGAVELKDRKEGTSAVFVTAAREVKEESLGALKKKDVMMLINQPTTQLVKNAGWNNFPAASFLVQISDEEGERIINIFNEKIKEQPHHEMSELAWISLNEILTAQKHKDEEYTAMQMVLEEERGTPFTPKERLTDETLKEIYNRNLTLPSGKKIAHFAARTVSAIRN